MFNITKKDIVIMILGALAGVVIERILFKQNDVVSANKTLQSTVTLGDFGRG